MKHKLIALTLGIILCLSGCANTGNTNETTQVSVTTETSETLETASEISMTNPYADVNTSEIVKIGDYKSFKITATKTDVSEDEIAASINNNYLSKDASVVEDGNYVSVSYVASQDDNIIEEDVISYTVGKEQVIDGFDENLKGLKIGDTKEFDITMVVDDSGAEDNVHFKITVTEIKSKVDYKEATDDVVKEFTDYESKTELYNAVKENLTTAHEEQYNTDCRNQVVSNLNTITHFNEISQELIDDSQERYVKYMDYVVGTIDGTTYFDYLKNSVGCTEWEYKEAIKNEALDYLKLHLMLEAIAREEGIEVNFSKVQDTLEAQINKLEVNSINEYITAVGEGNFYDLVLEYSVLNYLCEICK